MKKVLIILVLLCVAVTSFGWDYFAYYYEEAEIGTQEEVTGTVVAVFPYNQVWVVVVMTTDMDGAQYYASPVGLLFAERPKGWNLGDTYTVTGAFNGVWDSDGILPTFRVVP